MRQIVPVAALHNDIGDALAELVALLQVPVLILAVLALIACAAEFGRYLAEVARRISRRRVGSVGELAQHVVRNPSEAYAYSSAAPTRFAADAMVEIAAAASTGNRRLAEEALADYELAVQRRLDRTRLLVRAGPALGLMGTLIPLAPGLAALGDGDIELLASELRIAFAATVIGILVGTAAFALTLSRTRMYTEDLAALERAAAEVGPASPASQAAFDGVRPVGVEAPAQTTGMRI